ncbi:hypothetical protein [Spirosoma foliorum]|uniref:Uncharacterized protein n=1 Tax=Spirosoma foliorum TaxID=2710596 RepID=A0A7G5H5K6_9BACT|nr:hypothetical protein [Spirosoma foliorum]QMW06398.1 hypothetical protein H3H32_16645 [Spirosoma foliorum]
MFHNYSIIKAHPVFTIIFCIGILLICFQFRPATLQGKWTVLGLLGFAVGLVIALYKAIFD